MRARTVLLLSAGVVGATLVAAAVVARGPAGDKEPDLAAAAAHQGMVHGTVWVADEEGASLTAIDAATNKVITIVKGIEGPHNVQVAPGGQTVWAVSGDDSLAVEIDARTAELRGTAHIGRMPAHVVLTPDGATAYTTNNADDTVSVIDAATMKVKATIPVGTGPHGLRPSPDGRLLYVADIGGTTVSVIDARSNRRVKDVEVGRAPAQVAFAPDGRFAYVSLNGEDAVAKIDVGSSRLVGKVKVGSGPIQTYVSPDNRYLLVANQGSEADPGTTVSVVDTTTFTVVRTVETGRGAHGIVIEPTSRHAYITDVYADDVAVIDLQELAVVARVPVGAKPNGVSFSTVTADARSAVTQIVLPRASGSPREMSGMDMGSG